jgi:hypothetical protein
MCPEYGVAYRSVARLSFGGPDHAGIYHSVYDDFYHFTKFSDPSFLYGRALAQFAGRCTHSGSR